MKDSRFIDTEIFYKGDETTLKKHTTSEGYASLVTVQKMLPDSDKEIEVEILDEAIDGEITWVKYKTSYDGKLGIFKLAKIDSKWKVTSKGPREKGSF